MQAAADCLLPASAAPEALEDEVRRAYRGMRPGWLSRLGRSPWIVRAFCRIAAKPVAHVPPRIVDLITLVVSQDNSCRFCFGAQRAFLTILGYREDFLAQLERDFHRAELSPMERAALEFARRVSRADPRPGRVECDEARGAGLATPALVEIAFATAATIFTNRVSTLLALPTEPFVATVRHPLFRLVRPLVAWRMRSGGHPPAPLLERNDGPGARVVGTLAASPSARALRETLDEAWASPVLPVRTKALLLAVVSRALGCTHSEREACAMLEDAGFTAGEVEGTLAHLGSPRLDAREAVLVPFARETVRYQASTIQARARSVAEGLTPDELLEAVGFLALANALARLSVLVDAC